MPIESFSMCPLSVAGGKWAAPARDPANLGSSGSQNVNGEQRVQIVAGVDLGGTAVNYTLVTGEEKFLIEGLCEHPALSKQGPDICLQQIEDGLGIAAGKAGIAVSDIVAVGLDTPGPASGTGVLSARGSTNFVHADWAGYDIRKNLEKRLGKPVTYLNDGNAGALWGHFTLFGGASRDTSLSAIIGTGLGGGVIVEGNVVKGRKGFGGELGHVLIPYQSIKAIQGLDPECNCGRTGCLESVCSLTAIERSFLPYFLARYPGHDHAHPARQREELDRPLPPRPGPRHLGRDRAKEAPRRHPALGAGRVIQCHRKIAPYRSRLRSEPRPLGSDCPL